MASEQNFALWLSSQAASAHFTLGSTTIPTPGFDELVIENHAVPLHPADWKIQRGLLPIKLKFPAILGMTVSGIVRDVGSGVTRFAKGDRVLTSTAMVLRNDSRYGAFQKYTLTKQDMTSNIFDAPFDQAVTAASNTLAAMGVLHFHFGINMQTARSVTPASTQKTLLVWGGGSSVGQFTIQFASQVGLKIITTASLKHAPLLSSLGASAIVDYRSPTVLSELQSLGPYDYVFGAADTASDQVVLGELLASQGGGSFISTMGVRQGVSLPRGVTGTFKQYLDDFVDPRNIEFTRWFYWEFIEEGIRTGWLKFGEVEILNGGLNTVEEGLKRLEEGKVRGMKLIVRPTETVVQ